VYYNRYRGCENTWKCVYLVVELMELHCLVY
jgi:hypothetical protein